MDRNKPEAGYIIHGCNQRKIFGLASECHVGDGIHHTIVRIGIGKRAEKVKVKNVQIQFFFYLSDQCMVNAFARFGKSTGQIQSAFAGFFCTHGDQNPVLIVKDDGHGCCAQLRKNPNPHSRHLNDLTLSGSRRLLPQEGQNLNRS
nr:hypothetical protein [Desulfobacter hydrogenophilus]